jgi:hypothetical protein
MRARTVLGTAAVLLLAAAALAGALSAGRDTSDPARYAEAEAIHERTLQEQAWWEASLPIRLVFYTGLAGIGLVALVLLVRVGYLYLCRRACTIRPDRNGVLPAVLLRWRDAGGRSGEALVDAGALAGPLVMGPAGPEYRLPAEAVLALQANANRGAALTRATRAWASHLPGPARASTPTYRVVGETLEAQGEFPPVEVIAEDDDHVRRLLDEGTG